VEKGEDMGMERVPPLGNRKSSDLIRATSKEKKTSKAGGGVRGEGDNTGRATKREPAHGRENFVEKKQNGQKAEDQLRKRQVQRELQGWPWEILGAGPWEKKSLPDKHERELA